MKKSQCIALQVIRIAYGSVTALIPMCVGWRK